MTGLRTLTLLASAALLVAGCGGDGDRDVAPPARTAAAQPSADLSGVKEYLLEHSELLTGFTGRFAADAARYHVLASESDFDLERMWAAEGAEVAQLLATMKNDWVEGNPYYERMEGVVAGTPSLAEFDVILDAGSSAAEDPQSAVPFDLELPDGRQLKQPGNLFNLTEGALWGTLPDNLAGEFGGAKLDLDGNGTVEFGEVLPDAAFLKAAADEFDRYANDLARSGKAWEPTPSDAFTALVVMVPTMSEYFGQWKESRFVRGGNFTSESFNVVSRLSDIRDIVSGLEVVYEGVAPLAAQAGRGQSRQTQEELADLGAFVGDLHSREQAGKRFTPEEADALGSEAQGRATAIAGQVSQMAAELSIPIEQ
jgi:Imelysin